MDVIDKLVELFEKFPGIGPRQAERFVQHLLRAGAAERRKLADTIQELSGSVVRCSECMRFFAASGGSHDCPICTDASRDFSLLAITASNADLLAIERSHTYRGRYFVLGGTISLASNKPSGLKLRELVSSIQEREKKGLREVILAFPANPEGDATAVRVRDEIAKHQGPALIVTTLGRGLSTGSELEYADPDTIKNALVGRK